MKPTARCVWVRMALPALVVAGCQFDMSVQHLPQDEPILVKVSAGREGEQHIEVDPVILIEGARIFDERCATCHGEAGRGDGALAEVLPIRPRNYHEDEFEWGTRPSDIVRTIANGRSDIMPGFAGELSPHEMWSVAYVVWFWIPESRREAHEIEIPVAPF